ncbi:hypothetical protein Tco_0969847 [Tanacetum coccineum]
MFVVKNSDPTIGNQKPNDVVIDSCGSIRNTNFVRAFTASANSLLSTFTDLEYTTHDAKTGFIAFKIDENGILLSANFSEAEEEAVAREVYATHARIVSESEPEPTQRRQSGIAFRDSFIVSKKRSSDSSKKLKGIQTLTPAEQEAADIMKARSRKA